MARKINTRFLFGLGLFIGIPLLLVGMFFVILPMFFGVRLTEATDWEEYLKTAETQIEEEKFFEALSSLKRALERGGRKQPEVWYLYARASMQQRPPKVAWAIQGYRNAVKLDPEHFDAQQELTALLSLMRQWADSEVEARRLLAIREDYGMGYVWLAMALVGHGDTQPLETAKHEKYREAIGILEEGIKAAPDTLTAYTLTAQIYARLKEMEKTEEVLSLAVKNNQEEPRAYLQYSHYLLNRAEQEEKKQEAEKLQQQAWDLLEKAQKLGQDMHMVYLATARAAKTMKRTEQAVEFYQKAIEADEKTAVPYIELANIWRRSKELEKAEKLLKKGLSLVPDSVPLKAELASFYLDRQDLDAAEPLLDELEEIISENPFWPYLKGKQALLNGRIRSAINHLEKATEGRPGDIQIGFLLSQAYRRAGELGAARDVLKALVNRMPKAIQAREILISVLIDLSEFQEAVRHLKIILEQDPIDDKALILLARAQIRAGNTPGGLQNLAEALKVNPNNPVPFRMMGAQYEDEGDLEKAEGAYKKALAIDKNQKTSYRILLDFYRRHNKEKPEVYRPKLEMMIGKAKKAFPDEEWNIFMLPAKPADAIVFLEEKVKQKPDVVNMGSLAQLYATMGQVEKAIDLLTKIYKQAGFDSAFGKRAFNSLFTLLLQAKKYNEVAEILKELPEDEPGRLLADALLLFAKGQFDKAVSGLEEVLEIHPSLSRGHLLLGQTYAAGGNLNEAVLSYERALSLRPGFLIARLQLAKVLFSMRRFSAAASQANLALKHRPDLAEAYAIAAVAHEAQSDFVEAAKAREKLLELRPNLTTNSFRLGRLYERISKFEEAEKALKQALESKPDTAAIVAELASFYARHGQRSKGQALMSAFVNSHSEDPLAHRLQGTFYFRSLNALQPAIGAYDKAIALSKPKEMAAQPMMDKAEVFIGLKRYKDAVKIHRQALVLVPGDVKMMGRMAETQMLARDIDGAMATLKAIDKERPNNPPTMVLKAQVYTLQNKLEDAEKLLRRALAARPNYGGARLQWARIRLHEKDFLGAMAELQKISPNDVAFSPGMRQLARIQETLGQRVEAIRTLQRLLEVDPMSNLAQMSLARLHIANDQPDRAEKILKNLEKIRPNDAYIAMQLALAQERQGKFGAARANYQKAWALSRAQTVGALEGQVRMMVKMGQGEQAKALLRNMIAKDPMPVAPWILLAGAHTRAKQWAEAQKLLDNAISTHPASEKLYLEKATFFRAQGKDTEASDFLREALKKVPRSVEIRATLCEIYIETRLPAKGISIGEQGLSLAPKSVRIMLALSQCYYFDERLDKAIETLEKLLDIEPTNIAANNNLAYMLAEQGKDLEKAERMAERAKRLFPNNPSILDTTGYTYYLRGKHDLARRNLLKSIKIHDSALSRYHLGMVYQATGDKRLAAENYRKVLAMDPKFEDADDARKRLGEVTSSGT